jgi:hypothetical protein
MFSNVALPKAESTIIAATNEMKADIHITAMVSAN